MAGVTRRVASRATFVGSLFVILVGSAFLPAVAHAQNPAVAGQRTNASAPTIDYERDVKPVLSKCFGCHGSTQAQSGLRLDLRQNALRGGDYGVVIVPGDAAGSKLIQRLIGSSAGLQMPPTGELPADEIETLRAWIDQGAEMPGSAFGPEAVARATEPRRPEAPRRDRAPRPRGGPGVAGRGPHTRARRRRLRLHGPHARRAQRNGRHHAGAARWRGGRERVERSGTRRRCTGPCPMRIG